VRYAKSRNEKLQLLKSVQGQEATLLAAWPGEWSQDVFAIDWEAASIALGLSGASSHRHTLSWAVRPGRGNRRSELLDIKMKCGCKVRDIKIFAAEMREQRGWIVRTSGGWGGGAQSVSVCVQRSSLPALAGDD
jgi:hypothetical protein